MRRLLCLFFLAAAALASAEEELPALREARQALDESLPQIAYFKARPLISHPGVPQAERDAARLLVSEALAQTDKLEEALTTLQPLVAAENARAQLLKALILAHLGRWAEARPLFHLVSSLPEAPGAAVLGEAEALEALGAAEEAITLLEGAVKAGTGGTMARIRLAVLLAERNRRKAAQDALAGVLPATPEETKWKQYAEGRILLLDEQAAPALNLFEAILQEHEHLPENLHVAATFGATDAHISLHGYEEADNVLENFIWRNPTSPWLEAVFRRLDQVYAAEENPAEVEFHKWTQRPQAKRAALARFYVSKLQVRAGKWEKAAISLESFLQLYPTHPYVAEAQMMRAAVYAATGDYPESIRSLEAAMRLAKDPGMRPEIEFQMGLANFQQGEFLLAATLFESAARHSAAVGVVATFNAALAWLHQRNFERFSADYRAFVTAQPQSPLKGELLLEEGLVQARTGDPRASLTLQDYLREHAREPRQAEARVALAELAFLNGSPHATPITSDDLIRTAAGAPVPKESLAAADYLAVFQADAQQPRNEEKVIALARKFLLDHPDANQAPEVRMKLGQVYFRREDYANAETQFASLAADYPQSAYVEAALYLAGESAMKLINPGAIGRALQFFDRVVALDGKFKLYARQEQAIVQSRLGHEDQAIALYDLILSAQPDPELRDAALCGKGDNLVALGQKTAPPDHAKIDEAIKVYSTLANGQGVPARWRNQALYKIGKAQETLGRTDESLAAFYDVLNRTTAAEREFFWFFKAGFDAARLFEQQEKWKAAAGIYEKMSRIEGPRTAEAQSRLRQIRLEHFLWE